MPRLDYCTLANARPIPVAQQISARFASHEHQAEIGEIKLNISGCINACGYHHVGHIGILGVEKNACGYHHVGHIGILGVEKKELSFTSFLLAAVQIMIVRSEKLLATGSHPMKSSMQL